MGFTPWFLSAPVNFHKIRFLIQALLLWEKVVTEEKKKGWKKEEKTDENSGHFVISHQSTARTTPPNDDRWNAARSCQFNEKISIGLQLCSGSVSENDYSSIVMVIPPRLFCSLIQWFKQNQNHNNDYDNLFALAIILIVQTTIAIILVNNKNFRLFQTRSIYINRSWNKLWFYEIVLKIEVRIKIWCRSYKGALKYYISTFGGLRVEDMTRNAYIVHAI